MNYNNLYQNTNFIAGSNAFNNIPFFLTTVNIPGLSLSHPIAGGRSGTQIFASSDTITYNGLSFELLIDEDFVIYQEIMDIINKNISVDKGTFADFIFDFYIELNNSKGNKVMKIDFSNCRIASISDIILDTTDDGTEYSMSMELEYDSFEIEPIKRFNIIPSALTEITAPSKIGTVNGIDYQINTFSEAFTTIDSTWQSWGLTTPVILEDLDSTNGTALSVNSELQESGLVQNNTAISVLYPFEVVFRVKQPFGIDTNANFYLDFGITEGFGIPSTTNGRTGSTVMGVIVDGGNKDVGTEIKSTRYSVINEVDIVNDKDNNGKYHEYKFKYDTDGTNVTYEIFKDNVLEMSSTGTTSIHDFFYIYVQGKSVDGDNFVDVISANYG